MPDFFGRAGAGEISKRGTGEFLGLSQQCAFYQMDGKQGQTFSVRASKR